MRCDEWGERKDARSADSAAIGVTEEAAITLAEEEAEYGGAGVLVTGSVITVGEARLLLKRG